MLGKPDDSKDSKYGSHALDRIVKKLKSANDSRKRYEYVIWLGKKLVVLPEDQRHEELKVSGCVSQVYLRGELNKSRVIWQGYSDALITKGLLSLLFEGLKDLTPQEIININEDFITDTGLNSSLTASRANGFLNILRKMKSQANLISKGEST
tara:strand:- start:2568 stop:3026 length:459 start_codon:yes stop_codon:yes gene_type:complete